MSNIRNLDDARKERELKRLLDTIIDDLGVNEGRLSDMIGAAPENIRNAILDALENNKIYQELNKIKANEDELNGIDSDACHNMVCPKFIQTETKNYCKAGPICAQGCLFRMMEPPISDPWQRLPSHPEAIRMLQRAGQLKPDDFGEWNGTAFIFYNNVKALWTAYINLLIDTGKINKAIFVCDDGEKVTDFVETQKRALKVLKKGL